VEDAVGERVWRRRVAEVRLRHRVRVAVGRHGLAPAERAAVAALAALVVVDVVGRRRRHEEEVELAAEDLDRDGRRVLAVELPVGPRAVRVDADEARGEEAVVGDAVRVERVDVVRVDRRAVLRRLVVLVDREVVPRDLDLGRKRTSPDPPDSETPDPLRARSRDPSPFASEGLSLRRSATVASARPPSRSILIAFHANGPGRCAGGPATRPPVSPVTTTVVCASSSVAEPKMPTPATSHRSSGASATHAQSCAGSPTACQLA